MYSWFVHHYVVTFYENMSAVIFETFKDEFESLSYAKANNRKFDCCKVEQISKYVGDLND